MNFETLFPHHIHASCLKRFKPSTTPTNSLPSFLSHKEDASSPIVAPLFAPT